MKQKSEMPDHIDLDTLGKPEVGKYYKDYQEYKNTRGLQKAPTKVAISIRLDADVLEALRAKGKGWQAQVNNTLRESLAL